MVVVITAEVVTGRQRSEVRMLINNPQYRRQCPQTRDHQGQNVNGAKMRNLDFAVKVRILAVIWKPSNLLLQRNIQCHPIFFGRNWSCQFHSLFAFLEFLLFRCQHHKLSHLLQTHLLDDSYLMSPFQLQLYPKRTVRTFIRFHDLS